MSINLLRDLNHHHDNLNVRLNNIRVDGDFQILGPETRPIGIVTQITSAITPVTINSYNMQITTVNLAIAPNAEATFTVNNNLVLSTIDKVRIFVQNYTGSYATNGYPTANIQDVAVGSFKIVLHNSHGSTALNGVLTLYCELVY